MEQTESFTPQVFGRYLLVRRLSRGGMGEVYLAKSGQISGFEKLVVIKRILPDLSQRKDFSRRFIQEANIAIKLSHVNIVPVLEVGKVQGEFFLALEHVEGRDLRTIQSLCHKVGEPLPPYFALLIVRDLLTGLSYAHRREDDFGRNLEIVHCDISPPNVLVSYEGEIKIIDFGIAKSIMESDDPDETQKMGFGKFGYMAPEQILKGEKIDARTDLYSAGVILWELLTGKKMITFDDSTPFKDIARKVVIEKALKPSAIVPGITEEIDRIVQRAISKNAQERYPSASEFRDDVQLELVKIAPTITNENLGNYLKNLFEKELAEYREIVKAAKEVDIGLYQSELTTAMEETVSFAVGDDWKDMTGPASEVVVSAPAVANNVESVSFSSDSNYQPTPTSLIGQQSASGTSKFALIAASVATLIIIITGILIFLNMRKVPPAPMDSYSAVQIPPSPVEYVPPAPMPEKPEVMDVSPKPEVMKPAIVKNPVMHQVPSMVMKVMEPDMAMDPPDDKALEAKVMGKYNFVRSKYNKFEQSHGKILLSQFREIRQFIINKRGTPDFFKNLDAKLNAFLALMSQHKK
ncbi:serine/threonine protein kinase [Myxococcota bacterium]|nr:serine/threonine protein kinase [Myxococcota bacterium]MBU1381528.1 serine/threonine protein kinase [Myxococcota bacterium]MBU1496547.1 serine/threonine protein kinase [Myxococcota bacterium]